MPAIRIPDDGDAQDRAYEAHRQKLLDALIEGQRAGGMGLAPSLNPYPLGSAEAAEWSRGWHAAASKRTAEQIRNEIKRRAA